MSRFDTRNPEPPAIGQVAIIPFKEEFDTFTSLKALDNFTTCLIIKPNAKWDTSYFKFCGGMLVAGEQLDFRVAAQRELRQETGITCPIGRFHKILRTQKLQFAPYTGEFDVVLYVAFGCDFSKRLDPLYQEAGDEGEESALVRFGDIMEPQKSWPIPTKPQDEAEMFGLHLKWLRQVEHNLK